MDYSKSLLLFCLLALSNQSLCAQDLTTHQWKNRLLLIIIEDSSSLELKQQLAVFAKHQAGMEERKLLVYQITPQHYRTTGKWQFSSKLYSSFHSGATPFEVILIGLDGGIKWQQNTILSCEKLFTLIDGMPMRRRELQKKKY